MDCPTHKVQEKYLDHVDGISMAVGRLPRHPHDIYLLRAAVSPRELEMEIELLYKKNPDLDILGIYNRVNDEGTIKLGHTIDELNLRAQESICLITLLN